MSWTAPCRGRLTSNYGPRIAPTKGATTWHRGVDIAPPVRGQREPVSVHSVGPGRVRAVGRDAERGVWVVVFHDDGSATTYQHLAARVVAPGMRVDAGATLGTMGSTGTNAGVHLHLEAFPDAHAWVQVGTSWRSAAAIDPVLYLRARGVELRAAIAVSAPVTVVPTAPTRPAPLPSLPAALATTEVDMRIVHCTTDDSWWAVTPLSMQKVVDWAALAPLRAMYGAEVQVDSAGLALIQAQIVRSITDTKHNLGL